MSTLDIDDTAREVLRQTFGYHAFRGQQEQIVTHVAGGGDALVLMPTGGGKSLCYQIPALLRQGAGLGVTIVISPLIALMHDQVGALQELGIDAAFLNSSLDAETASSIERRLLQGEITLLYVAPERLNTPRLLAMLQSLHERAQLALFAIDECHCVSQWGHDFRPEYRTLSLLHERYASVPRVALTATADETTRLDIIAQLQLESARVFVSSFDRPNIRYHISEKTDGRTQLLNFIQSEHEGEVGIVYALSRKKVEETADWLSTQGVRALAYHAGLDSAIRAKNLERFLRHDSNTEGALVMVATIAFGMGIDKPDVRFVAHLDSPKNIEAYYQETGRAGRDGEAANAWTLYGLQDVVNQRRMIDESPAGDAFKAVLRTKLDALLQLAESMDCRRGHLLRYFGQEPTLQAGSQRYQCGNCDNCLNPAPSWDATEAARQALSCIYRIAQHGGVGFGAGHVIDVLRGKATDKVAQHGHAALSTFGIGAALSEGEWRTVLRQLVAIDAVAVNAQAFNTLELTDGARPILRGERAVQLREAAAKPAKRSAASKGKTGTPKAAANLSAEATPRFAALKAWRAEVAREHGLPAYVIFHDATLAAIATQYPASRNELATISGVGGKKLDAYGEEILRVLGSA